MWDHKEDFWDYIFNEIKKNLSKCVGTGKSLSEAFILKSTNPQHDKRLSIDLPVQYMKTTSSEHLVYINCSECQNKEKQHVLSL